MYQQSYSQYSQGLEKKKKAIDQHGPVCMEGMERDAAAPRIENGVRKEVVHIDENSCPHDQDSPPRSVFEEKESNDNRDQEMDAVMYEELKHGESSGVGF